jgi:hypothetical protein
MREAAFSALRLHDIRPKRVPGAYPKTVRDMKLSARKLDKMIEEATVDCYDELEQASGFYTMIEDHLAVPFVTEVLGVEVSVVGVEMDENGSLKAVCERNGKRQLIGLIDLELPKSPPSGAEWIAAYRHWLRGR